MDGIPLHIRHDDFMACRQSEFFLELFLTQLHIYRSRFFIGAPPGPQAFPIMIGRLVHLNKNPWTYVQLRDLEVVFFFVGENQHPQRHRSVLEKRRSTDNSQSVFWFKNYELPQLLDCGIVTTFCFGWLGVGEFV